MNLLRRLVVKTPLGVKFRISDLCECDETKLEKQLEGVGKDTHENLNIDSTSVKLVKRFLNNGDTFLFFEFAKNKELNISLEFDDTVEHSTFEKNYEKPPFSTRYGENEISGPCAYVSSPSFTAMVSKQYYYKELTKKYDSKNYSKVLKLIGEGSSISFEGNIVKINMKNGRHRASFSMLISKEKLFKKSENIDAYIEYYFKNLKNNSVQNCTFFNLYSGAITKLPYSIEPSTKMGYGFNLHHSSRYEMTHFYRSTNERFYYDMLSNAIMQTLLYRSQNNGVFFTEYTSTWIKDDCGITSPYIDTRLNEAFCRMVDDYKKFNPFLKNDCLEDYLNYLTKYIENMRPSYRSENGLFFPDYFKDDSDVLTHTSLNHQIGIATLFYRSYLSSGDKEKLIIFERIINFIDDTYKEWINPDTGDLFYGCKMDGETRTYFDEDYTYVTLIDLLIVQKYHFEVKSTESIGVDFLINQKISYLSNTEFNIYQSDSELASGEALDSKAKALKYLLEIEELKKQKLQ